MKLIMTLLVRDADDLVQSNLEFHLRLGVDHVIVMDNLSTDRTKDILGEYERRGVVTYIHQPEDNFSQSRWVTTMARLACAQGADWVINNDADEFWYPDGRDLKSLLSDVPPKYSGVEVERLHFVPRQLSPGASFADEMTVRYVDLRNPRGKAWAGKVCHRGYPDVKVHYGNHGASISGKALRLTKAPIEILHFPMRSYEKFENTIVRGGAANERNPDRPVGRWQQLYEVWKRGELRAYFDAQVPDSHALAAGLRDGRFARDERLKRTLHSFSSDGAVSAARDGSSEAPLRR
jgi:glycosyltransferase involved in cell wall biosynthesis